MPVISISRRSPGWRLSGTSSVPSQTTSPGDNESLPGADTLRYLPQIGYAALGIGGPGRRTGQHERAEATVA